MRLPLLSCLAAALTAGTARAQVPAGGEFQVNTYTTSDQYGESVALDASGRFVVSWVRRTVTPGFAVDSQRFGPTGAPAGAELQVNSSAGSASLSRAAFTRNGAHVIVWAGPGTPGFDIYAQRYGRTGQPVGGEFRVNTNSAGNEYRPDVARLRGGGFVVCWSAHAQQYTSNRIIARRFDANGAAQGGEIIVAGPGTTSQNFPAVASAADGSFVIVWKSTTTLVGRRFDGTGNPLGSQFQVNEAGGLEFAFPRIAMAGDGAFVVAWEHPIGDGSAHGIRARRFTATGAPIGSEFTANSGTVGAQRLPSVVSDRAGNFVVAWDSAPGGDLDIMARRFSAAGLPRGAEFRVNTYTTQTQAGAELASDPVGNFVAAWSSLGGQDGSGFGVFAQRFGGLLPAPAAMDTVDGPASDGNLVLEPGETVDFRPSWLNVNGAAQAFTGSLSAFTGPPATYGIVDGTGGYGTVPNGSTAACTDCYELSVSAPSPRPLTHWDAQVREALAPDAQGQVKAWNLHVGDSFTDVPRASAYYRFVEALLHNDVTGGCGAAVYCPLAAITREQMAVFLLAARDGPGDPPAACGATPVFPDVPVTSPFCPWVEELFRGGVVGGCGGGNYCPQDAVTREQMAVFLLRTVDPALNPPACVIPVFNDVPATSPFCRWIEELVRRGIAVGCGGGNYCPVDSVTREQMAVFIVVGFGLNLYGP